MPTSKSHAIGMTGPEVVSQKLRRMSTTYLVPEIQSNYSSTVAAGGRNFRLPNPI